MVQPLALLSATQERLLLVYNQLAVPLAEQESFINPIVQKQVQKSCKASLLALEKAIDAAIAQLIAKDEQLKDLFALMTSVPGIGVVTATEVIVATNEVNTISESKSWLVLAGLPLLNTSRAVVLALDLV